MNRSKVILTSVPGVTLEQLFRERFGCDAADYEDRAFRRCLYWHARWVVPVLRLFHLRLWEKDLKFIRYLGSATDLQEAKNDVNNFHVLNEGSPSFWRNTLRMRVSGRNALMLVHELLSSAQNRSQNPFPDTDTRAYGHSA